MLPCLLLSALGVQRTPQAQGNCTNTSSSPAHSDSENSLPWGGCDFPAPGTDRLQLSSLEARLPVVRGVPVWASCPSSMPVQQSLERQVRMAVKCCCFWKLQNFLQTAKDMLSGDVICSPELSLARQTPGLLRSDAALSGISRILPYPTHMLPTPIYHS